MTKIAEPSLAEIEAFARRHGLTKLKPEHIARMRELAPKVAEVARTMPRVPEKEDAPTFPRRLGI